MGSTVILKHDRDLYIFVRFTELRISVHVGSRFLGLVLLRI